jgi:hypothetical protein
VNSVSNDTCGVLSPVDSVNPSANVAMTAASITVIATIKMTPMTGDTALSSASFVSCISGSTLCLWLVKTDVVSPWRQQST